VSVSIHSVSDSDDSVPPDPTVFRSGLCTTGSGLTGSDSLGGPGAIPIYVKHDLIGLRFSFFILIG